MKKYFLLSLGICAFLGKTKADEPAKVMYPNTSVQITAVEIVSINDQTPQNQKYGPEITFEKTKHNFGTIEQGVPVKVNFVFTNTGNSNLVIKKSTAGCGCTTPVHPKEPIAPGKKGEIEVGYDAKATGNFVKDITVETNAGTIKLIITGVVEVKPSDNNPGNEINIKPKKN